jgi:uncharacterized protein YdbL (DUF1318 family)
MKLLKKTLVTTVIFSLFTAQVAFALDLQTARSSGAVVEKSTGYIDAAKSSPEVDALVADVNAKRKAEYERIAKEKGQPVEVVAKLAAQELSKTH